MPTKKKAVAVPPATPYPDDAPLITRTRSGEYGFPLPNMFRWMARGEYDFALAIQRDAEADVRRLLAGEPRSTTFRPDTDPVKVLTDAVVQVECCKYLLRLDNEAHYLAGTVPIADSCEREDIMEFAK